MAAINKDIISEIEHFPKTSDKMKEFLRWILEYEREHSDQKLVFYKTEIEKKLDGILKAGVKI